jgi:hypothetical protein
MRLIDADKLIENMHQGICCDQDFKEDYEMMGIDDYIRSEPTAYDLDKVINELENKRDYYQQERDTDYFTGHVFDENYNRKYAMKEAIEIVKRGGLDG